ncbi:hypothetical protein [Mycobacterium kyogaense]|uniref:hypothetical protein n=1 Tax=Mycobacterium kyogaense TaxID=2212479 RepID=UPI0013C470C4|nr:hypothetical protein [Mycobacterium kyogaense]
MTIETGNASSVKASLPRSLQCRAYRCTNAIEDHGMCSAHRRGLALSATVADAIREFLQQAPTVANGRNTDVVADAGKCFAHGLALLVGTQFAPELAWNSIPLSYVGGRWRVRFAWAVTDEQNLCGPIDFADFELYADNDEADEMNGDDDE